MHGYCTRMIIITVRYSYASAVLGVIILSVCLSIRLSHACFVTNPKNLLAIFLYHILITVNMQSKMGFPSSHQLKSYVAPKSCLQLAAHCPVSRCWPSCCHWNQFKVIPLACTVRIRNLPPNLFVSDAIPRHAKVS